MAGHVFFFKEKHQPTHDNYREKRKSFQNLFIIGITLSMEYVLQTPDDRR